MPSETFQVEQAIISSLLIDPSKIKVIDLANTEFRDKRHFAIYSAMCQLSEDNEPVNPEIIFAKLSENGKKPVEPEYFFELVDATSTSEGLDYWIKRLREIEATAKLLRLSDNISTMVRERQPVPDILEHINKTCTDLTGFGPQEKVATRVKKWIESLESGVFSVTECDIEAKILSDSDKSNRRQALSRLVKEGIIERVSGKAGVYRKIDQQCEIIRFKTASIKTIDFRLPFGMERFLWIMPKNILCFAGSPDSGKTALLLNIIYLNQGRHHIHYFSSEMGEMELRSRLQHFDDMDIQDWNFNALERSDNFAEVIKPNAVNIIDFLEITDNFYAVGQRLFEIHKRLRNGIAIVALQKDPKAEYGRGQSFSLEKPRLYCTVDSKYPGAILRIKKCKNWRDEKINPNNRCIRFKIVKGCNLQPTTEWEKDL